MAVERLDQPPTVANLIRALSRLPQDDMIVLASDPEGNKFSPWDAHIGRGLFVPHEDTDGSTGDILDYDSPADREIYEEEHGEITTEVQSIVLWSIA